MGSRTLGWALGGWATGAALLGGCAEAQPTVRPTETPEHHAESAPVGSEADTPVVREPRVELASLPMGFGPRPGPVTAAELAEGERAAAAALATPLQPTRQISAVVFVEALIRNLRERLRLIAVARDALLACATTGPLLAAAHERVGGLYVMTAVEMMSVTLDAERAPPDRDIIPTDVIGDVFCLAVSEYQQALTAGEAERARAELEAFGAGFLARCVATPPRL